MYYLIILHIYDALGGPLIIVICKKNSVKLSNHSIAEGGNYKGVGIFFSMCDLRIKHKWHDHSQRSWMLIKTQKQR